MPRLFTRRCKIRYYLFFTVILFITGIQFLIPSSILKDEFNYSTVLYPSPFDSNHTNFFIYLNKKDRLATNEDQISLSKRHKILDDGLREINKNANFLFVEYTNFVQKILVKYLVINVPTKIVFILVIVH